MLKIVIIAFWSCLLICGCAGLYGNKDGKKDAKAEVSPFKSRLSRYLGECPVKEPGRAVRMLLLEQSGEVDRLPEIGFGCGRLPNDVGEILLLVNVPAEGQNVPCCIPEGTAYMSVGGAEVSYPQNIVERLEATGVKVERRSLTDAENDTVSDWLTAMFVRYGEMNVQPLLIRDGKLPDKLQSWMLHEVTNYQALVIGLLPAGTEAERPDWRREFSLRNGLEEPSSAAELLLSLSSQLGLMPFELDRHQKPTRRNDPPPEDCRDWHLLAFLETTRSIGLTELVQKNGWTADGLGRRLQVASSTVQASYGEDVLNEPEARVLLSLARLALSRGVLKRTIDKSELPQYSVRLQETYGCSLSLLIDGKPYTTVSSMGGKQSVVASILGLCAKMIKDGKKPLSESLLERGTLRLGIITSPRQVNYSNREELYSQITRGTSGVILRIGGKAAGFVPQVWKEFGDVPSFMTALCGRCGVSEAVLDNPDTRVQVFEVIDFEEPMKNNK